MNNALPSVSHYVNKSAGHVHLVGICGIGMAGLALLLKERGFRVTGCDLAPDPMVNWLAAHGIEVSRGHSPGHIREDVEWVIRSTAVPSDCPDIRFSRESGILVVSRGEVLPELLTGHRSVAVAGTHGKTTTASFIVQLLKGSGRDPSWCIGGETDALGVAGVGKKAAYGGTSLVVEADESDGTLALYKPDIAVVTNVEFDHMEYFEDEEALKKCFQRFIQSAKRTVIYGEDDPGLKELLDPLSRQRLWENASQPACVSYGFSDTADIRAKDLHETASSLSFTLIRDGNELGLLKLPVIGEHNALNALAAVAVAFDAGLSVEDMRNALARSTLPLRRCERVVEKNDILVISDYAHHPTEISALVRTTKKLKHSRLLAVFQPHRYTRTKALGHDFPPAFEGIDKLILTPVYAASEKPVRGGRVFDLYAHTRAYQLHVRHTLESRHIEAPILASSLEQAWSYLRRELRPGDILLVIGAGDVEKIAKWAKDLLQKSDSKDMSELPNHQIDLSNYQITKSTLRYHEPLAQKTTLKVGGRADIWAEIGSVHDLAALLKWAHNAHVPFHLLGVGSNVLVSDAGVRGLVARLVGKEFKRIKEEPIEPAERGHRHELGNITVGAGVTIAKLLSWLENNGWAGLEFLEGIPSTIGGAMRMNAGAWGHELGEYVSWIRCLNTDGSECLLEPLDLGLGYRRCSSLQNRVLVDLGLTVRRGIREETRKRRTDIAGRRGWMRGMHSAGSVFKNPEVRPQRMGDKQQSMETAGRLLEKADMKGVSIGGARVSTDHANVIVTEKGACASDVRALIEWMRIAVAERFGIMLEEEIVYVGE